MTSTPPPFLSSPPTHSSSPVAIEQESSAPRAFTRTVLRPGTPPLRREYSTEEREEQQQQEEEEEDAEEEGSSNVLQYYQVDLKELTDVLQLPAEAISAQLARAAFQPRSAPSAFHSAFLAAHPPASRPTGGVHFGADREESTVDSTSTTATASTTAVGRPPQLYRRHHSTLYASTVRPDALSAVARPLDDDVLLISSFARPPRVPRTSSSSGNAGALGEGAALRRSPLPPSHGRDSTATTESGSSSSAPGSGPRRTLREVFLHIRRGSRLDGGGNGAGASTQRRSPTPSLSSSRAHGGDEANEPLLSSPDPATPSGDASATRPRRRVHFPEDVIQSVSVEQEENHLQLLLAYKRPWYAGVALCVAAITQAATWSVVGYLVSYSHTSDGRAEAAPLFMLVAMAASALPMLLYLCCTWRPGWEERDFLQDGNRRSCLAWSWVSGVLAHVGLLVSMIVAVEPTAFLCYGVMPMVITIAGGAYAGFPVTALDVVGGAAAIAALLVPLIGVPCWAASREHVTTDDMLRSVTAISVGCVGAACFAWFLRQLRVASQHVSHLFVLTSTNVLTVVVLLLIATFTGSFDSDAHVGTAQAGISRLHLFPDVVLLLGAGVLLLVGWWCYHVGTLYFDALSSVSFFALGTPVVVLVLGLLHALRPLARLLLYAGGAAGVVVAAVQVLIAGYLYRRNIEIRIVLDRDG